MDMRSINCSHLFSTIHYIFCLMIVVFGAVRAQTLCRPPILDHGYFVPEKENYPTGNKITYACDLGHKPAVEGWWVISQCESGEWSPSPKCIDTMACIDPAFSNGKLSGPKSESGVYQEGTYYFTCAEGYVLTNQMRETECRNGNWTLKLTCEKGATSCGKPLKISNAVIMHDEHVEIFPPLSKLQFKCEDSYTVDGNKEMTCFNGQWTVSTDRYVSPPAGCKLTEQKKPNPVEQGEGTENVQEGGFTQAVGKCPSNGGECDAGRSAPDEANTFQKIDKCGALPTIENAVITTKFETSITYQCNEFYKLHGQEQVMCYRNGSWSTLPTCIDDYCKMPKETRLFSVQRDQFVKEQQKIFVLCKETSYYGGTFSIAMCDGGVMRYSECKTEYNHRWEWPLIYRNEDILA